MVLTRPLIRTEQSLSRARGIMNDITMLRRLESARVLYKVRTYRSSVTPSNKRDWLREVLFQQHLTNLLYLSQSAEVRISILLL